MRDDASVGRVKLALSMVACTLCTWAMMGDTAVITAGNDIFLHFDGSDALVLNFILSGPALIQVVMGPVTGKLLERMTPKTTLLIGFGAFGVGGIFGASLDSVAYVAAMRALAGVGMGMVNVSSLTLISDLFPDEGKRGSMIGIWNAGMSVIGAIISFWAGMLVLEGWESVFHVYWVAVPVWIFVLLVVPSKASRSTSSVQMPAGDEPPAEAGGQTPWRTVIFSLAAYFVSMALFCAMYYCTSLYTAETAIGDGGVAGLLTGSISLGTLAGCLAFGPVYRTVRAWVPVTFWTLLIAGYAMLFGLRGVAVAVAACFILGIVNGLVMSYYQTRLSVMPAPRQRSFVIGLAAMVLGLSMFLSTYLVTALQALTGASTFVGVIPVIIVLSALGLAASFAVKLGNGRG